MKRAVVVHGTCDDEEYFSDKYPSLSNSHWFPWLQKQLLMKNIFTQTPEMPEAYKPDYEKWKKEFERFLPADILIGHSCGGGLFSSLAFRKQSKFRKIGFGCPVARSQQKTNHKLF